MWFSPGIPVFSTNKTDHHDISEILLKLVLNTINLPTSIQDIFFVTKKKAKKENDHYSSATTWLCISLPMHLCNFRSYRIWLDVSK